MRIPCKLRILLVGLLVFPVHLCAEILRDPIGVNVSAARPMSLTVRFADSNNGLFTSDQALFCYRQLANGQCDPSAILGRLPASQDRGSTSVPTSRITDVMTIPYSVIRSALSIAQGVDFSDFFYIRRFVPAPGVDLGAGVGQPVYQKVTCHFAGPARVPLSLTKVSVFGREDQRDEAVRLIRLSDDNLNSGQVVASIEHTGTGFLEGWWEVRRPGEPEISAIDLIPEAALEPSERGTQTRYQRIQRFRVQATTAGVVIINGPEYSKLPRDITGRHDILLRIAAGSGRENRARLDIAGEPLFLFSGGVAAFRLPSLEYHVPVALATDRVSTALSIWLIKPTTDQENQKLAWNGSGFTDEVAQLDFPGERRLIAPARDGVIVIPNDWPAVESAAVLDFSVLGADESVLQSGVEIIEQ